MSMRVQRSVTGDGYDHGSQCLPLLLLLVLTCYA